MTDTTIDCDILIVGAGIAGAALACALRDRDYSIVQVELSGKPLDTSRGDHFQCTVVEALDRWGVLDAFWAAGAEKRLGARYVTIDGEVLLNASYDDLEIPHPYYMYLNHELLGATFLDLAGQNSAYTLLRPCRARNFETGSEGITALNVKLPDEGRATIRPRMVVGADGKPSKVRETLGFSCNSHEYEHPLVILFGPRTERDPRNEVISFIGPKGTMGRIPRMGNKWKIGVPIHKRDIAWWKNSNADNRRAIIADRAPPIKDMKTIVGGFYPITLLNTTEWVRGNTVLLGDACHAMHPARGQGMNVAIRCLARLVDYLPNPEDMSNPSLVAARLKAYEAEVKPLMDIVLAENAARADDMDTQDYKVLSVMQDRLRTIQSNTDLSIKYRMASAGYGDPLDSKALK